MAGCGHATRGLLVASLLGLAACTSGETSDAGGGGSSGKGRDEAATGSEAQGAGQGGSSGTTTPDRAKAVVEIHARDIWAQPLPEEGRVFEVSFAGTSVTPDANGVARVYLAAAGELMVTLRAPEHEDLAAVIAFDGTSDEAGARVASVGAGHGVAMTHATEQVEDNVVPVHRVYLGLRHKWFSAEGRPARHGNDVKIFMDGESAWRAVHDDMAAAQEEVLAASWWWESDFELVRDPATHAALTPGERWQNTMLGVLESNPAIVRILVGQLWGQDGILSGVTVDDDLLYWAERAGDGIEYMGQANATSGTFLFEIPTFSFADRVAASDAELGAVSFDAAAPIASTVPSRMVDLTQWPIELDVEAASYHQKFSVIDHRVAFVGGMNVKATDWDTSNHYVFEPRRMPFEATFAARQDVALREALPDTGPRKDYVVRVEGPAAQDVADVFHLRWESQRQSGVEYAENASGFDVVRDIAPIAGGKQVQITATLPEPFWEHAIAETWFNAVRNAERFIFIEDQYFRIPMLTDAIFDRMATVPDLRLVVITKPVSEWTDPGCAQTHMADTVFETAFPDRYMTLQLRSWDVELTLGIDETDARFVDMDVHSKVLLVDDLFASIGSCNKNNRGIVYEGELNVAIVDRPEVTALRRRIFANLIPAWQPTDDVATWWSDLRDAADYNDWVVGNWDAVGGELDLDGAPIPDGYVPRGFLYSLEFAGLGDCLFESVGPDMTGVAR